MRVLCLKSPESLQQIGYDETNDVRQDTCPEWRNAAAHEGVGQKHEENRDAEADANETKHLGQVGVIRHERTRLSRAAASARESRPSREAEFVEHRFAERTSTGVRMDGAYREFRQLRAPSAFGVEDLGDRIAASSSKTMLVVATAFAARGIIYNIKPLRSKDRPYVDVLTESVNSPLRLMIGWAMVDPSTLPPLAIGWAPRF
jgi:hypothetical protein